MPGYSCYGIVTATTSSTALPVSLSQVDVLWKRGAFGTWTYKPVSEKAKKFFEAGRFKQSCESDPGWYGNFESDPGFVADCSGLNLRQASEPEAGDPDGPRVPLPVRKPHRYELLGYTPQRWGDY